MKRTCPTRWTGCGCATGTSRRRVRPPAARAERALQTALRRRRGPGLLAHDGAIDGVDQHLGFDEFKPRPLGLVAVERRGKRFCKGVAVLDHALARFFQRLKSLAHVGFAFCWSRDLLARKVRPRAPSSGIRLDRNPATP